MKGIILAGGLGTRMRPLTNVTNKHLLPVYDRPMIHYGVEQFAASGISRIMIVTGGNDAGEFLRILGNGASFGLQHLDYTYQERAGGIAEALGLCEWFADGGPIVVLLGDNIFERSVAPIVERFRRRPTGARIVLASVEDPRAYGVAEMDGDRLVRIVEKPQQPPSHLAVTGLYFYDNRVFDMVRMLTPSHRGELEITDVNNRYLELGELTHELTDGFWADCGESFDSLLRAGTLVATRGANRPPAAG